MKMRNLLTVELLPCMRNICVSLNLGGAAREIIS